MKVWVELPEENDVDAHARAHAADAASHTAAMADLLGTDGSRGILVPPEDPDVLDLAVALGRPA